LGITGVTYTVKNAYAARIEIYKNRGEMDKAFADYIKMSEFKEKNILECEHFVSVIKPEYEIIDVEN
jgi:hypothetical protein